MPGNVVAIVTLYFPDGGVVENVRLMAGQVSCAVLSDNTPGADNSAMFAGIPNARYFANKSNLGLSAAFNRYLQLEICKSSDYVIFFDQDTQVVDKQVETLIRDFEILKRTHRVGYLGPCFFDTNSQRLLGIPEGSRAVENNCFSVRATITSSCISQYAILKEVGFWNEHIFLDYADLELGWRLVRAGFENFVTANVQMRHRFGGGARQLYNPFKRRYAWISVHQPVRLYYQMRDGTKLLHYSYVRRCEKILVIKEVLARLLLRLLLLDERASALDYWGRGLCDGIRGIDGALTKKRSWRKVV